MTWTIDPPHPSDASLDRVDDLPDERIYRLVALRSVLGVPVRSLHIGAADFALARTRLAFPFGSETFTVAGVEVAP